MKLLIAMRKLYSIVGFNLLVMGHFIGFYSALACYILIWNFSKNFNDMNLSIKFEIMIQ